MNNLNIIEKINKIISDVDKPDITVIKKNDIELYNCILNLTKFLIKPTLKERIYCIKNSITSSIMCPVCGKRTLKFDKYKNRYRYGCCHKCTINADKYKLDMIRKYGYQSPNQSPKVKQNKINSLMKNYGVVNSFQIPYVKENGKNKRLIEHGDCNWNNRRKARETYRKNTGYDNPSQNPEVKNKKKYTCITNNGVDNPSKIYGICEKKIESCRKSNGVDFGFLKNKHVVYNSISKLNKRIYQILNENNINYIPEFKIIYDNGRYKSYDICFEDKKTILEINGDFWHGNPLKYRSNDVLNLPHIGKIRVCDIWKKDKLKKELAEKTGYFVFYIWECDMKKMSNLEIFKYIKNNLK